MRGWYVVVRASRSAELVFLEQRRVTIIYSRYDSTESWALHQSVSEKEHREPGGSLTAIREFAHYLDGMEKELSHVSKKLHTKETAQSARFVTTGIHEARQYLEIVKKVIEKTQRAMQKTGLKSRRESNAPSTGLRVDGEMKSRTLVETWKGLEIWQGKCESCHTDTRIVFDGTSYLCVGCLKKPKSLPTTEQGANTRGRTKKKSAQQAREERGPSLLKTLLRKLGC